MSNGPIEFLSDGEVHEFPATEMGGADGLIQPAVVDGAEAHGDEALLSVREGASEMRGIMERSARRVGSYSEQVTGVSDLGTDEVIDPLTGRAVPVDGNKLGGKPGELSDLKPK